MFALSKKEQVVQQQEQAAQQPPRKLASVPKPQVPIVQPVEIGVYENLAEEIGFAPAKLLEEQILRFLKQEGIHVYDYQEVDAYMTAIAVERKKIWIWRPLREQDIIEGWSWRGHDGVKFNRNDIRGHGSYRNEWEYRPYDKAVPIEILREVKKTHDHFGEKVKFFVSDYADPRPDPFIMVTALDVNRIIFGFWDEPGFAGKGKK